MRNIIQKMSCVLILLACCWLSSTAQAPAASILTGASNGNNQTFSVKYKATPGFAYPAGVYAVDVTYTATQQ